MTEAFPLETSSGRIEYVLELIYTVTRNAKTALQVEDVSFFQGFADGMLEICNDVNVPCVGCEEKTEGLLLPERRVLFHKRAEVEAALGLVNVIVYEICSQVGDGVLLIVEVGKDGALETVEGVVAEDDGQNPLIQLVFELQTTAPFIRKAGHAGAYDRCGRERKKMIS